VRELLSFLKVGVGWGRRVLTDSSPLHVIGTGELGLVCTGQGHGEPISCKLEEAEGVIEGVVVELAPGR
jgi:hypothetical protein